MLHNERSCCLDWLWLCMSQCQWVNFLQAQIASIYAISKLLPFSKSVHWTYRHHSSEVIECLLSCKIDGIDARFSIHFSPHASSVIHSQNRASRILNLLSIQSTGLTQSVAIGHQALRASSIFLTGTVTVRQILLQHTWRSIISSAMGAWYLGVAFVADAAIVEERRKKKKVVH